MKEHFNNHNTPARSHFRIQMFSVSQLLFREVEIDTFTEKKKNILYKILDALILKHGSSLSYDTLCSSLGIITNV